MTRENKRPSEEEALQTLYGNGVRDLTAQGYFEALTQMRKGNPAGARRVERALAPFLEERVFPRRRLSWHQSSEGLRARLSLLPANPHVEQDIRVVREVLGIPEDQIKPCPDDQLWKEVSQRLKRKEVRRIVEGNLCGKWHRVHQETAVKSEPWFSEALRQSAVASAKVDLRDKNVSAWLQVPPSGPAPYDGNAAPLDWAAGRLVERHGLPWSAGVNLSYYILTENPEWVTKLETLFLDVTTGNDSPGSGTFNMSIRGIDEFVTKDDWDILWDRYVRPRQVSLREHRGMQPEGSRAVDISRLQKMLPVYRAMVQQNLRLSEILKGRRPPLECDEIGDILNESDAETVRRTIRDLKKLLAPAP